jgi:hypothetical protein
MPLPERLIHVTPQLPPNVGGVADYAVILGRRVAEQTDERVRSVYVQAGSKPGDVPAEALDSTDLSGHQSAEALAGALIAYADEMGHAAVLLHYVGYGYHARGCPVWLLRGLRQLRARRPAVTVISMFHELYATSRKPWKSVFWLSPVQCYLTAQIARLSDGIMTNRRVFAEKLRAITGGAVPVCVSPTFSNVGEPEMLPAYHEREPYAVVFGGAERKTTTYGQHGAALGRALQRLEVERVVDIGTPAADGAAGALGVPVEMKGELPAAEVSAHLRQATVGVLRYGLHCLTKSGLWAAYAAHGVPAVMAAAATQTNRKSVVRPGAHYFLLDELASGAHGGEPSLLAEQKRISENIRALYNQRFASKHAARKITELLTLPEP